MSRFLPKLEHCSGENAEILHNHLKQSKLKIQGFRIDPNSREAVTVVVSSFTGHLGNWVVDHADEIFKLDNIDALICAHICAHQFFQRGFGGYEFIFTNKF
jgi:hypothetical protein